MSENRKYNIIIKLNRIIYYIITLILIFLIVLNYQIDSEKSVKLFYIIVITTVIYVFLNRILIIYSDYKLHQDKRLDNGK